MIKVQSFTLVLTILITSFSFTHKAQAQSHEKHYIKITKLHRDLNVNMSMDKWIELEKDYLNKVIMKNEFILQRDVLNHYMTEDNTEVIFIQKYKTWGDIELAEKRSKELEKKIWPDSNKRNVYLNELGQYFNKHQSDEIFITVPGMKEDTGIAAKSLFYQMRVNHLAFPKDGTEEDFLKLNDTFLIKSVYNNHYIKGYYPFVQVWGSDKRNYIEVTAVASLNDLENAFKKIDEFLYEPKKEDEAKHHTFIANYFRYFTGFHADYIYKSIPELKK
jgi:hypothetical protein